VTKAWPATLSHGDVRVRPLRVRDARRWQQLRQTNNDWLQEWEATSPMPSLEPPPTFRQSAKRMLAEAKLGRTMPFVVEYQGTFVGQINVSDITYGSLRGCHFGYWIDESASDKRVMTTAAALVTDHLLKLLSCTGSKSQCGLRIFQVTAWQFAWATALKVFAQPSCTSMANGEITTSTS
jgi:[ribosomal protein S5]-alanine N-acetyltransferase